MFFGWLKHFSSEYFSHIVLVMQTFLTYILTNKSSGLDPTPVVLVIDRYYIRLLSFLDDYLNNNIRKLLL